MTGDVSFGGSRSFVIYATDDTSSLVLAGGTSSSYSAKAGAALILSGKKDITGGIPTGHFSLAAADGTSLVSLIGSPNGSLAWNGRKVLTGNSAGLTVVAESYGANSWYRKYSDGWIEQGGLFTGTAKREAPSKGLFGALKLFDLSLRLTITPLLRGFSFIEHRNGLGFHNRNDSEFLGTNRSWYRSVYRLRLGARVRQCTSCDAVVSRSDGLRLYLRRVSSPVARRV